MAYKDFRDFLDTLHKEGQLLTITDEVQPDPDLGSAGQAISNLGDQTPGLLLSLIHI